MKPTNAFYNLKLFLLLAIITSPIWGLLFFHFLPDEISKKRLRENGIKTMGKVIFYSIEKRDGPGKLGGLNTRDIMVANYIYHDNRNNIIKGKAPTSEIKISKDSTLVVFYLGTNPNLHLVISNSGEGSLGKTRN